MVLALPAKDAVHLRRGWVSSTPPSAKPKESEFVVNFLYHLALYGVIGWCVEIVFTSLQEIILHKNIHATGKTYLWMHPIYGLAGLGFEAFKKVLILGTIPLFIRIFFYLILIYVFEYASGYGLKKLLGRCPWDYGDRKWAVHGLIRLDYAPFWFILCWMIEPVQAWLEKMFC